jgi:serine phosphatase RsbU (regulator of sigma subunit)
MSRPVLRHVLGRTDGAGPLVTALSRALGVTVAVQDANGRLLHGDAPGGDHARFPVRHADRELGWVSGDAAAAPVATLLEHLVSQEVERKALGSEVLHLYREINLIYSFSEKLAALLDVERVAQLTLQEARHLIEATDGALLLIDAAGALSPAATFGDGAIRLREHAGRDVLGMVAASGSAEVVNDAEPHRRPTGDGTPIQSLIAAPLKVGERVMGVVALGSSEPKSYTAGELKLLTTLALQAATAIENARLFERTIQAARERERLQALHRDAEVARARLESELALAARIQAGLFPGVLPTVYGHELAARNRSARQCGGDYYDVLSLPGDPARLLICVADVAGKGLPAALLMSNMQATLRALLGRAETLPQLAAQASELLLASTSPEKYVTAALAELDTTSGAVRWVGAGHLDNLVLRADGSVTPLVSTGMPLGLLPDMTPYGEATVALEPGDTLVLFSDGVTEAQDARGDEFGEERLLAVLRDASGAGAAEMVDRVFGAIDAFAGHTPQFDDITLLVVRRSAGGA